PTSVAPRPEARPAAPPRRGRRWPWLLLILALVVVGGLAAFVVSNLTGDSGGGGGGGGGATPVPGAGVLPIAEAKDFDPFGPDGAEHPNETRRAIDGDPATAWPTEEYSNRNFGNAKPGVGLWVRLDAPHDITTVTVTTLEGGWSADIYVADQAGTSLDAWGPVRATGDNLGTSHPFDLKGAHGQYVLVWCTHLPPSNKLQIAEINVEGR
ncbi:MAG: hypothetical protein M3046_06805, partial [Actinomycetota bacterium]|nr:hypothetical protein [Actinomycetota bacterium]